LAANTLGSGCQQVITVVRDAGGAPESTVIGFGDKLPAAMAAFANGAMGHALNYDASGAHGAHLGTIALPAPLAVAEKLGGVSGKEFLAGMAAGAEITARLATAAAVGMLLLKVKQDCSECFMVVDILSQHLKAA
jgi:2-methylcitrate dehydratase PrpD